MDKLEDDLKSQRQLAGELIAAIRVNFRTGRFSEVTENQLEIWLEPFIARPIPYEAPTAQNK